MTGIFILEDEAIIAADIAMSLEYAGFSIHGISASAEDALERLAADPSPPELAVVDIILTGGMDGIEACRILTGTLGIPVVFLTSHTDAATIERASRAGAYGYVVKPFTEAELKASVEVALQKASSHADERARQAREAYLDKLESLALVSAGTAHLFNNLLQVISGYAELIAAESEPGSTSRKSVNHILDAADRASEIAGKMRNFTGSIRVYPETADLRGIVKETVASRRGNEILSAKNPDFPCLAKIDRHQIDIAVRCLLENALEAVEDLGRGGESAGRVVISSGTAFMGEEALRQCDLYQNQPAGNYSFIEVSDTGIGMDAELRKRMFDPFFTTRFIGRGLGLAVVMGVARSLQGLIEVNTKPGAGTSVRLLFESALPAEEPAQTR